MLWLDLKVTEVFGLEADISPRYKPIRLTNDDGRVRERYLKILEGLLCPSEVGTRIHLLYDEVAPGRPLTTEQTRELNDLFKRHDEMAKMAERKCRKLCMGAQAWTPEFSKNRDSRMFWLRMTDKLKGADVDSRYLQRLARKAAVLTPLREITRPQAEARLACANAVCYQYSKIPELKRQRWIEEWAKAEANSLNITEEEAIKRRYQKERSRIDWRIIKRAQGTDIRQGVSKVCVEDHNGIHECSTKEETEAALLTESSQRFRQAHQTPPLTALFPALGNMGTTTQSEKILDGTFIPPGDINFWTKEWIKEMARPATYTPMSMERSID
jgi:hypothetical protein